MIDNRILTLSNGVRIEIAQQDGAYLGLGSVRAQGRDLRSSRRPFSVIIRTPEGVEMVDYRILGLVERDGAIEIELGMSARHGGPMDWMLHEVRPRLNVSDWTTPVSEEPGTRLYLTISPVSRSIGAATAVGFSYRYRYVSDAHPIYKIVDRGTWEVGGGAVGNEFYLRNAFAPSIYPIASCTQSYSTEWYLPLAANSSIFQFVPWQTTLEGFSLTCHGDGNVITWCTQVSHIRSLFEKQSGLNEIVHWHEHCGDLALEFETPAMEVLFIAEGLDQVGRLNLYHDMRELVAEELHRQAGFRRERVSTYGIIEEWGMPDFDKYRRLGLPKLIEAGVRRVMLPNEFENNMNVFGVHNMCCTIDYKVAENVGEENLTGFCADAAKHGVDVEMWGNTALSVFGLKSWGRNASSERLNSLPREGSIMEVIETAADPFVCNPAGHKEADHYSPEFAQLNLLDEDIRAYWMKRWTYASEKIGLRGIFLDSSFNLTSDKFHWRANSHAKSGASATPDQMHLFGYPRPAQEPKKEILSQYHAHLSLMAQMQAVGYVYCGEDIGVFGIHRSAGNAREQIESMSLWSDCLAEFNPTAIVGAGGDPDDVFFRGLAYRQMWRLSWDMKRDELSWHVDGRRDAGDEPTPWQIAMLNVYNVAEPHMRQRTILHDEQAVVYVDGNVTVLWAFEDMEYVPDGNVDVFDVVGGTSLARPKTISAARHRVYLIAGAE